MTGSIAGDAVRVALAGHAPELVGRLAASPGVRIVAQADQLRSLVGLLGAIDAAVVYVHDRAYGDLPPEQVARQIGWLAPGASLAWLTDGLGPAVSPGLSPADRPAGGGPPGAACFTLPAELDAALEFASSRRSTASGAAEPPLESGGALRPPPRPPRALPRREAAPRFAAAEPVPRSRVVSVFGAKGGVGKTTVAVNLALAVAAEDPATALIDLDLRGGCAAVHLDLLSDPTVVDLACALPDVPPERVAEFTHRHSPSGLAVVTGPSRPELADLVRPDAVVQAVELLSARHRCLIADHGPGQSADVLLEVLDRSSLALLVTTLDAAALRATRLLLGALARVREPLRDRISLVCNGVGPRPAIAVREAEEFLGARFAAVLPVDRGADGAVADGTPLMLQPGGELARAVQALARETDLVRRLDDVPRRSGPLAWLRGR